MSRKVTLTGIKPTGSPHLGNLIGAIHPALALAQDESLRAVYFIADYHALTTIHDGKELHDLSQEIAAAWIACGLDPERVIFYRQSDVPEIFELTWILACFTPKGKMNRAHAYKAAVAANQEKGVDVDAGVNMGLYNYPILMAADILMFGSDYVPVGSDQVQHVEMARFIAERVNQAYGPILKLPEAKTPEQVAAIPGIDGRKMSKSYSNTVPLFESEKRTRKLIMKYVTDSSPPNEPKDPEASPLFHMYKVFASKDQALTMAERFRQGIGWGEVKDALAESINEYLREPRRRHEELMANPAVIDDYLAQGAEKAREVARELLQRLRQQIGMRVG